MTSEPKNWIIGDAEADEIKVSSSASDLIPIEKLFYCKKIMLKVMRRFQNNHQCRAFYNSFERDKLQSRRSLPKA